MHKPAIHNLVLASSSRYRKALLERLKIPFICASPDIDETAKPGETPENLVRRLSASKAQALASQYPNALIIGSDQVASHNNILLTKPGNFEMAFKQLKAQSGNRVTFLTGIALLNSSNGQVDVDVVATEVAFRPLSDQEISDYLRQDQPYDCAGSFKSEGLGITLFKGIYSNDPSALVGLPLIRLAEMLRNTPSNQS